MKLLLQAGADPNVRDEYSTPFKTAGKKKIRVMDGACIYSIVRLMQNASHVVKKAVKAPDLFFCVYSLFFAVIMIRKDEFSHRLNKNANFCGFTPLHYASLIDSYDGVKLLLQGGNMNCFSLESQCC